MKLRITLLIFILLFFAQNCFAMDINELNIGFFNKFNDENLNCYIQDALNNNHNLKKAGHVVEQYRQQTKYSLGRELPSLSVSANYLGIKVPELDNFQLKENAFILPFMASYEADFLLKNRDKTKAVKKSYEAIKFNEKAVYIALLTDVATVYTNILQYDDLIEKQTAVLKNQEEILNRSNKKFARGIINSTELNNAKKNVETSKSKLERLQKERETAMMQLAVLTGNSSSNIADMKVGDLDNFEYSGLIPEEISSDVIFSRPDVKMAEANLEKAKIDVRVAKKEFLPSFNLTGLALFNAANIGSSWSTKSMLASIGAAGLLPIFTGGSLISNLRLKKTQYERILQNYYKTNLTAIQEVNDALVSVKKDTEKMEQTKKQAELEKTDYMFNRDKYNQGTISKLDLIQFKENLLSIDKLVAQQQIECMVDYISLYKAAGSKL